MKVDLHCHTKISDCSYTFEELLTLAATEQVSHLAIVNHDTTKELDFMVQRGAEKGIEVIPGIEISAFDFERNRRVHILGYYIDPANEEIERLCRPLREKRHQASYEMVRKLIAAGYDIRWEDVEAHAQGGTGVYKQHIMHALMDKGLADGIFGATYKKLFARGTDTQPPGIAFIPMEYVDAAEAIQVILAAGGVPVLAHPAQYKSFEVVPKLVAAGLRGIEVWHPLHNEQDEERAKAVAEKYGLIMTGGTDFHGTYGEKEVVIGSKNPGLQAVEALKNTKSYI